MIVVADGKRDTRNAVRRARRVAPTEAAFAAAAVVQADVAQQSGVHDRVDTEMVGARRVHPHLRNGLAPSSIVPKRLYLRGRQSWRRRVRAGARSRADVLNLFL